MSPKHKKPSRPADPVVVARTRGAIVREAAPRTPRQPKDPTAKPRGPPPEGDAYSVIEFCERHRISVPMFYKLAAAGPRACGTVRRGRARAGVEGSRRPLAWRPRSGDRSRSRRDDRRIDALARPLREGVRARQR